MVDSVTQGGEGGRNRAHAPFAQFFAKCRAAQAQFLYSAIVHAGGCGERRPQNLSLRVSVVLQPGATSRVRFAGRQKFLEAIRSPESIGILEQLQNSFGPQFRSAVAKCVEVAYMQGQFAAMVRHGQPVAQVGQQIFEEILAVASGKPTKSESLGIGEEEFVPWFVGPIL